MSAMPVAGVALLLVVAPVVADTEGVRLLAGFEPEEWSAKLGRWEYIGKPQLERVPAGWKGEKIESPDAVGDEGFQIIDGVPSSSRHMPGALMVPRHATQGRFAFRFLSQFREMGSWANLARLVQGKGGFPFAGELASEPGYDPFDWYFQRFCHVWRQAWNETTDWSGFDRLRFDVTSVGAPVILGVRVRDGVGPRINAGPTGIRTALGTFHVPADRTVTCDFPLAEMARTAELDLGKVHRYHIRINGLVEGRTPTDLFLDNIRLVTKEAAADGTIPVVPMDGEVRPFVRPVFARPPTPRNVAALERRSGPVEALGPVTIDAAPYGGFMNGYGHFGGSGTTYFQNLRRAVVAYDNDRLLFLMAGRTQPRGGRGGLLALRSTDGGASWTGLVPEDRDFTVLPWRLRANACADAAGDVYMIGTPNCDSYNEGQDINLHRLAFTGETWVDDRFAIIYQDGYKCPGWSRAVRLESGRIWAAWHDGFGGDFAKHSDDDGFTWQPCKDPRATDLPRPFYEPALADREKAEAPPPGILLWPATKVPGPILVPYRDGVAAVSIKGDAWAIHDGAAWQAPQKTALDPRGGIVSEALLGETHVFLAHTEPAGLVAARWIDNAWTKETIAEGNISESILTASGDCVFCLFCQVEEKDGAKVYQIRYRRWKAGAWEPAVTVTTETDPVNHIAAPVRCPPDYVAFLWDQRWTNAATRSWVRFVRLPNR